MNNPIDFRAAAAQLAKPEGEDGITTAEHMNTSNADMTRHAIDLLDCEDGDSILEIGPGNGRFAEYVLLKGANVRYTGVDISETMVAAAQKINKPYVSNGQAVFKLTDGLYLPFSDNTFHKIFTVNTLYFWKNPALQLMEIRRVLKPSGIFCLAIASKRFMETLPFSAYGFTLYAPEEAEELLLANGFVLTGTVVREHKIVGASKQEMMREEIFITAT
ncbi:class I SAM-dependent methyltransferase [Parapedobacter deserti]|uniref:Class I SAM-dependent methyltransferase n=1 Tax=Parapedobacter deserti TaxID=1912957 RepID=A0ABV7JL05_9SPHI